MRIPFCLAQTPITLTFKLKIQILKKYSLTVIAVLFQVFHPLWHWGIEVADMVWHLTSCYNWQITNLLGTMSSGAPLYREVILQNLAAGSMILAGFTLWFCCRSDQCFLSFPKLWRSGVELFWFIVMLFDKKQFYAFRVRCEKIMSIGIHFFFTFIKIDCSEERLELFDVVLMSLKLLCMPIIRTIKNKIIFS